MITRAIFLLLVALMLLPGSALYARESNKLLVDDDQVKEWNLFTQRIYELHLAQISDREIIKKVSMGGYLRLDEFYREEKFYDRHSGQLLSRIQWEKDTPANIHLIEVFVYDSHGELQLDYLSAYLPQARNAPIQTLINFHHHDKSISAYRQFDASGERIYEQCKGSFFGKPLSMSLDEWEIPFGAPEFEIALYNDAYPSCFGDLATEPGELINPVNAVRLLTVNGENMTVSQTDSEITALLKSRIKSNPNDITSLNALGIYYFQQRELEQSIKYLSRVLELQPMNDEALFWRGMAYGRNQQVALGIADLDQYIARNPTESRAYTKRGVRYIWLGDLGSAKKDLLKAIELDAANAEAHDDLGVIYAQEKNYSKALKHFRSALRYVPDYQKAWHNMAMVHYLTQRSNIALESVNKSLELKSTKDSLMLKSLILEALGQHKQAGEIKSVAENIQESNWSETYSAR